MVAAVLIALSVGLGYLWLRESSASGNGYIQILAYDVSSGSQVPLANFPIIARNKAGLSCAGGMTGVTNQNGNYLFSQCTTPVSVGLDPVAGIYEFFPGRAGYAVHNNINISGGFSLGGDAFAYVALKKTDGDGDGVYDIEDNCPTQKGPSSNRGCPVPAPAPAPAPSAAAKPAPKVATATPKPTTSTQPKPSSSSSSSAPATPTQPAADTQPPAAVTGLSITAPTSGRVELEWAAASDNVGVARYSIERSADQATWSKLDDSVTDIGYTDLDAPYGQKQYYRVIAFDSAGNGSEAVTGEITISEFDPNVSSDIESEVVSEDGLLKVVIPAGAVSGEVSCAVVKADQQATLNDGAQQKVGPYSFECKGPDGNRLEGFAEQLTYTFVLNKDDFKSLQPALFTQTDDTWSLVDAEYDTDTGTLTYKTDKPATILIAGVKQSNMIGVIVTILIILLLLSGGGFWWWRRRNGSGSAPNYTQYITPPTPEPTVSTPGATAGSSVAASPTAAIHEQPPGQHAIEVPGLQAPLEGHQAPHSHHSPLDRLDEMEQADTQQKPPQNPS